MTRVREIRRQAKLSQTEAAALAHRSPNTWRLYEAAPEALTEDARRDCDAAVDRMREIIRERSAA